MPAVRLAPAAKFPDDKAAPLVSYTGTRVNATATSTSSAAAALPAGATAVEIRCSDGIWIRFGASGVGAAAADANSQYVPAGEKVMVVPFSSGTTFATHFRVLRVGSADVLVQIESLAMQA